tara:strand:+ start:529 stop:795 length:267 start_codon:yes stop_codon:yes gene_type:complete
MALKKQSIRKNMHILANGSAISKEELILISEDWTDVQEQFFRKMLKQGGHFRLKGVKYIVELELPNDKRSDGSRDIGIIQIPGESQKF